MAITKEQAQALARPFAESEIEWLVLQAGKNERGTWIQVSPYLTARAVMDRLDEVFGVGGWSHSLRPIDMGEIKDAKGKVTRLVGMVSRLEAGGVAKEDVAECSDIEPVKGGASGALKRSAVQFGVGRYLYWVEQGRCTIHPNGAFRYLGKDRKTGDMLDFRWDPPRLPEWALPTPGYVPPNPYAAIASSRGSSAVDSAPIDAMDDGGEEDDTLFIPPIIPVEFSNDVRKMLSGKTPDASLDKALAAATKKAEAIGLSLNASEATTPIQKANRVLAIKAEIMRKELA